MAKVIEGAKWGVGFGITSILIILCLKTLFAIHIC